MLSFRVEGYGLTADDLTDCLTKQFSSNKVVVYDLNFDNSRKTSDVTSLSVSRESSSDAVDNCRVLENSFDSSEIYTLKARLGLLFSHFLLITIFAFSQLKFITIFVPELSAEKEAELRNFMGQLEESEEHSKQALDSIKTFHKQQQDLF